MTDTVRCERCGREPRDDEPLLPVPIGMPLDWEGSMNETVCPGCQYAEWHPHCTAARVEAGYGARIDNEALQRGETATVEIRDLPVVFRSLADLKALPEDEIGWCDFKDLSVSWVDGEDPPTEWTCASCRGTEFEGVHRDYPASNLKGTTFTGEVAEEADD